MAKVCFDYGHGGRDPGAVYKGRKESNDNLALGKAVAAELRKYGVAVVETRTGDKAVSLKERSDLANKSACDYFISFHRNAFKPEQAKGRNIYLFQCRGHRRKVWLKNTNCVGGSWLHKSRCKDCQLSCVKRNKGPGSPGGNRVY